jgi:hypothetical protein
MQAPGLVLSGRLHMSGWCCRPGHCIQDGQNVKCQSSNIKWRIGGRFYGSWLSGYVIACPQFGIWILSFNISGHLFRDMRLPCFPRIGIERRRGEVCPNVNRIRKDCPEGRNCRRRFGPFGFPHNGPRKVPPCIRRPRRAQSGGRIFRAGRRWHKFRECWWRIDRW